MLVEQLAKHVALPWGMMVAHFSTMRARFAASTGCPAIPCAAPQRRRISRSSSAKACWSTSAPWPRVSASACRRGARIRSSVTCAVSGWLAASRVPPVARVADSPQDRRFGSRIDAVCEEIGLMVRPLVNMCVSSPRRDAAPRSPGHAANGPRMPPVGRASPSIVRHELAVTTPAQSPRALVTSWQWASLTPSDSRSDAARKLCRQGETRI